MRTYSNRDYSYYRKKKRRRVPTERFLFIVIALLVVVVGVLAAVVLLGKNDGGTNDVTLPEEMVAPFKNHLEMGEMNEAVAYWEQTLAQNSGLRETIDNEFEKILKECIVEGVDYTCRDTFDSTTFVQFWGGLDAFGVRASTLLETEIDALVSRYKQGDAEMTYDKLKTSLERLNIFTSVSAKITSSKETLELYSDARQKYDEGIKKIDAGEYLDGLALLKGVSEQTELYNKAQEKITATLPTARTAIMEEANSLSSSNPSKATKMITDLIAYFPNDTELINLKTSIEAKVTWVSTTTVDHLFTHCLVAYPELGFSSSDSSYDADCITPLEFKRILEQLYANNYVLVDIGDLIEVVAEDGQWKKVKKATVRVPQGKKPFVFSIDDVVYDSKKTGRGMVDKIVVGPDNRIGTVTNGDVDENGKPIIRYDLEVFPILESFIQEHPDFSIDGARGTLALTGFDGILGYRTQEGSPNRESEIVECKKVIAEMKRQGWTFGSHSMNHARMPNISDENFRKEINEWVDQVGSLVGEFVAYYYPYGNYAISPGDGNDAGSKTMPTNVKEYGEKHKVLLDAGFLIFNGTGSTPYYQVIKGGHGLYMDRRALDGYSLRNRSGKYKDLFDCKSVYDTAARVIPYPED